MSARALLEDVSVSYLSFSPDSRMIAAGSMDGSIYIRDTETMKPLSRGVSKKITGHTGPVTGFCFDPSYADRGYQYALSCSLDETVRTWDVKHNVKIYYPMEHPAGVQGMAISADGSLLACILVTNLLYVWTLRPGRRPWPLIIQLAAPAIAVAFSPQNDAVATGDAQGSVHILDLNSQSVRHISAPYSGLPQPQLHISIDVMAFTVDGRHLICGSTGPMVRIVTLSSSDPQSPLRCAKPLMEELVAPGCEYDHTKAIMVDDDGVIKVLTIVPTGVAGIWTVGQGGKHLPPIRTGYVWVAALSRDGKFMLTGKRDGSVVLWDLPTM